MFQLRRKIEVKTVVIKTIRKAHLPLGKDQVIDLDAAAKELKDSFDIRYDPSGGFKGPAMYVIVGRASYCIFRNGTVMIAGNLSRTKQTKILTYIWNGHLKLFLKTL